MAKLITNSTPKADGFRMPGEFEEQKQIFMIWPERTDNWRAGAKPAQKTFANVAAAISEFEPVTMCVSAAQYEHAKTMLPAGVRIIEMSSNDAWCRDMGPSFLINDKGETRACDWTFNAWADWSTDCIFHGIRMIRSHPKSANWNRLILTEPVISY